MCAQSCLTLRPHGACQAPLTIEFPRQEYLSGLSFPSLGDLPDPRIEPMSPALAGKFFTTGINYPRQSFISELKRKMLLHLKFSLLKGLMLKLFPDFKNSCSCHSPLILHFLIFLLKLNTQVKCLVLVKYSVYNISISKSSISLSFTFSCIFMS